MMREWDDRRRSFAQVTKLFNQIIFLVMKTYDISKSTVIRTIQRFEEINFIKDQLDKVDRQATNHDKTLNILQTIVEDPHISICKVIQQYISPTSVLHQSIKF